MFVSLCICRWRSGFKIDGRNARRSWSKAELQHRQETLDIKVVTTLTRVSHRGHRVQTIPSALPLSRRHKMDNKTGHIPHKTCCHPHPRTQSHPQLLHRGRIWRQLWVTHTVAPPVKTLTVQWIQWLLVPTWRPVCLNILGTLILHLNNRLSWRNLAAILFYNSTWTLAILYEFIKTNTMCTVLIYVYDM